MIGGLIILFILFGWVISGLVAFIMSLVCFGYNGSVSDKFIGLIIAVLFGPFYWIFYAFNTSYCIKN